MEMRLRSLQKEARIAGLRIKVPYIIIHLSYFSHRLTQAKTTAEAKTEYLDGQEHLLPTEP